VVNPAKHPQVKQEPGMTFIDWISAAASQAPTAGFKINGEPAFFHNAAK
jgi:tungstate transport system substrate-binding protein